MAHTCWAGRSAADSIASLSAERFEAPQGPLTAAAWVAGDFAVLAEIARGGMGMVYLARQHSLGRPVAPRMLPADLAGDEVTPAGFRREMRLPARREHPNISPPRLPGRRRGSSSGRR